MPSELRRFFVLLFKKPLTGFSFVLSVSSLVFLPAPGYYQKIQSSWQKPQVSGSHFVLPPPVLYPKSISGVGPPEISAKGVVVLDPVSSVRLFEKNSQDRFLPASTSKIMTALVAMDTFRPEEILTVPTLVDNGQDIKLIEGEKITAANLLYALLVASANDAAETLANSDPGGRANFIKKMNEKSQMLSLKNTAFVNPTGIDEKGEYTSVFDLAVLTREALRRPLFAALVATQKITIQSIDGTHRHEMENINQLLGKIDGVVGVKTGQTEGAGECLVTYITRGEEKLIIVLLASKDRFGETEKLIDWAFGNFEWFTPTPNL